MSQARGPSEPQGLGTIYSRRRLLLVWKSLAEAGGALHDWGGRGCREEGWRLAISAGRGGIASLGSGMFKGGTRKKQGL